MYGFSSTTHLFLATLALSSTLYAVLIPVRSMDGVLVIYAHIKTSPAPPSILVEIPASPSLAPLPSPPSVPTLIDPVVPVVNPPASPPAGPVLLPPAPVPEMPPVTPKPDPQMPSPPQPPAPVVPPQQPAPTVLPQQPVPKVSTPPPPQPKTQPQLGPTTPNIGQPIRPDLIPLGKRLTAHATEYGGNTNGACGINYKPPAGWGGVAVSSDVFGDACACGQCFEVTYGAKTINVMGVDECPECLLKNGDVHMDLFLDSWLDLAQGKGSLLSLGILRDIQWKAIPCGFTESLKLHWKDGSNADWAAISVRGHNIPVVAMSVKRIDVPGSPWLDLKLDKGMASYVNPAGNLEGSHFAVKLVGNNGQTLVLDKAERLNSDQEFGVNF